MTDVLAYQIGAVFFLVVLFMAGTMTRGLFPDGLFKNIKLTAFVVAALLVGFLVYRNLPDISSIFNFDSNPGSTVQTPAPEPVTPAVPAKRASAPRSQASQAKTGEVRIIQPADPEPDLAVQPAPADLPQTPASQPRPAVSQPSVIAETRAQPTQESGNKVKRAMKSMGHFLHLGHEQYHPGQSAPQDASAP
jgi:hypothetical protein